MTTQIRELADIARQAQAEKVALQVDGDELDLVVQALDFLDSDITNMAAKLSLMDHLVGKAIDDEIEDLDPDTEDEIAE